MVDYEAMNKWMKFRRRHEANIFNAIFLDKEKVTDEDIASFVTDITTFFNLPRPEIIIKSIRMKILSIGDIFLYNLYSFILQLVFRFL